MSETLDNALTIEQLEIDHNELGQDPAYPLDYVVHERDVEFHEHYNGISIRLKIAAMAMQGLLANSQSDLDISNIVTLSYNCADELLKQSKP